MYISYQCVKKNLSIIYDISRSWYFLLSIYSTIKQKYIKEKGKIKYIQKRTMIINRTFPKKIRFILLFYFHACITFFNKIPYNMFLFFVFFFSTFFFAI